MSTPDSQSAEDSNQRTVQNPLEVMQDGEKIIFEVKRHPVGIIGVYVLAGALLIFLAVMVFILVPDTIGNSSNFINVISGLVFFIMTVLTLIFVFISTIVYWGNHWIVTSDSLTQISQVGLFRKQSAQLSLESLEDVGAEKAGIFAHLFNYGTLRAETAGEREKFMFRYCPNPDIYAQKLLATREAFEHSMHSEASATGPADRSKQPVIEQLGQAALADLPDKQ